MSNGHSFKRRVEKFAYIDETLDIRFATGDARRFERVPEILYRLLNNVHAKDRFYDKYIRRRYPNKQIDSISQPTFDK